MDGVGGEGWGLCEGCLLSVDGGSTTERYVLNVFGRDYTGIFIVRSLQSVDDSQRVVAADISAMQCRPLFQYKQTKR